MGGKRISAGDTFGSLEAVELVYRQAGSRVRSFWICRCACGQMHETESGNLRRGNTRWCAACASEYKSSHRRTHGYSGGANKDRKAAKEYNTWLSMRRRCTDPQDKRFSDYGGRGIAVAEEWMASFEAFLRDMGDAPSADHQIDRIDNEKGYSRGNCRWATRKEQGNNKRNNRRLTIDGIERTLGEWSDVSGVAASTIARRASYGWKGDQLICAVKGTGRRPRCLMSPLGRFESVQVCAKAYGRGQTWVYDQIRKNNPGWSFI